jgi:hypothetical protein
MVRRTPTEPNAATAGVILDSSFARFRPSMATFNEERTWSRPGDLSAMVETGVAARKRCGVKVMRKNLNLDRDGRWR